ncbi:MAG: glycosyltransferase family 4 protein [Clostridia bacterium]|nr:glycosyltransferase family 4 protein [Clostridia bacterium]
MYSSDEIKKFREKEFSRREENLKNSVPQKLKYTENHKEQLHITYVMTWTGVCGGSKIILEHANRLTKKGHKITLISHDKKPDWYKLESNIEFIEVPWENVLCKSIPKCDIIVATYWREIYECIEQKIAPVIYFEQGDYHLFDLDNVDKRTFEYIKKQFETVKFVYTISNFAKEKIKEIYNKDSIVIPNAIDKDIFYSKDKKEKNEDVNIALIGSENAEFKRIGNIIKALKFLQNDGYKIDINWITPDNPKEKNIKAIVNPPQKVIADTLRKSDIYICASMFEAFCLPVLEAMTCGTAVITTNNGGNMDFIKDNENALLIEKDNIQDICDKTKILIENIELRNKLAENAIKTSQRYSWEKTLDNIEKYYRDVAKYEVI